VNDATDGLVAYPVTWNAPPGVSAFQSTRPGGVSAPPFDTLNLARHVGDAPGAVDRNRARVALRARFPSEPVWLAQVHGTRVVDLAEVDPDQIPEADASVTFESGRVAAVLTADCLPVLFVDRAASRVAAAHAGWRGLTGGVLEATVAALDCPPGDLIAWLGPGIGGDRYEVGPEVVAALEARHPFAAGAVAWHGTRACLSLAQYAAAVLAHLGVGAVTAAEASTADEPALFFSHRRDGTTGRQGSFVWLT